MTPIPPIHGIFQIRSGSQSTIQLYVTVAQVAIWVEIEVE
jgi:hypothetical protein